MFVVILDVHLKHLESMEHLLDIKIKKNNICKIYFLVHLFYFILLLRRHMTFLFLTNVHCVNYEIINK